MKRLSLAAFAVLILLVGSMAADKKTEHKMAAHKPEAGGPDVAYLQKIWDAWGTMKTENVAGFYDQTPDHVFFDDAPLKYNNWGEFASGVQVLLKDYKALKLTLNDDVRIHREGALSWATATVKEEATSNGGKHEMATLRWTVVFERVGDKWLIAHEHVSRPAE